MNFNDLPPDIGKHIAGPAGSALALYFLKGTRWFAYVGAFLGGCAMARYIAPVVNDTFPKLGAETSGFLVGLFGVVVVKKLFDTWTQFDAGTLLKAWASRKLGLDNSQ